MSLEYEMRYFLEHKALPKALHESRAQLMASLLRGKGQAMIEFYKKAERANPKYHCPYTLEQFSMSYREYINQNRSVFIMRIGMPEPEQSPLCRAVYICFAGDGCEDAYFTSELAPNNKFFLCAWADNNVHLNYGNEAVENFDRVAELFWEMNQNGGHAKHKSLCRGKRQLPQ
ncbi:MAG: hypothetical protein IKJ91_05045 [Clostridia bacterium]|nr:hypothetical protein [Clostridia bacterium]